MKNYKPVLGKAKPSNDKPSLADFHPVPVANLKISGKEAGDLAAKLRNPEKTPTCTFVTMYDAQVYVNPTPVQDITPEFIDSPKEVGLFELAPSREETIRESPMSTEKVNTVAQASVSAYLQMRESVDTKLRKAKAEKRFFEQFSQKMSSLAKKVEQETRGQALNMKWFYHIVGKISSSGSHQIGHLRPSSRTKSVLDSIFGCTERGSICLKATPPVSAAPLSHGQRMEPIARRAYIQQMKSKGCPVVVAMCGLFVSKTYPWLASSPNGLVIDKSTEIWSL